jgi:hypothetical protein
MQGDDFRQRQSDSGQRGGVFAQFGHVQRGAAAAAGHQVNVFGPAIGKINVMGRQQERDAAPCRSSSTASNSFCMAWSRPAIGSSSTISSGFHGQHAGYADALFLTKAQVVNCLVGLLGHANCLQGGCNALAYRRHVQPEIERAEGNIFLNAGGKKLVIRVLENHADFAAQSRRPARL